MTQNYEQALTHLTAIGVQPGEFCNFRAIHDRDRATAAIKRYGTIESHWQELCQWNNAGYGIFVTVAQMDGSGYDAAGQGLSGASGDTLAHVSGIRAHYIDCDTLGAMSDIQRASNHNPPPSLFVQSSPNKGHIYWPVTFRYRDNDYFANVQRKLAQLYNGDARVHDATRVMRLAGFYHQKGQPHLVTCHAMPGYGHPVDPAALASSVAHVNVFVPAGGQRHSLGDPELAAPSLEWIDFAFKQFNPNEMTRDEWISFTAAIKQAMWSLTTPEDAFNRWSEWCAQYNTTGPDGKPRVNDPGENWKQWSDLTETQVGWSTVVARSTQLKAMRYLRRDQPPQPTGPQPAPETPNPAPSGGSGPVPDPTPPLGEILTAQEQATYFKNMVYVSNLGVIIDRKGRHLGATSFNAEYGGKLFILDDTGKTTDEPWKAATRGRVYNVAKVDHLRFLPHLPFGELVVDELGRSGVNTYRVPNIVKNDGNIDLFLRHMELLFPIESDRGELFRYFAHVVKYPGYKIPWAPFIQSAEGVGKNVIKIAMTHAIGAVYFYSPKANELIESGSKFNAWMREKLFILVDEIKVDERRDLVEVLKPMISEEQIEVQGKGKDQGLEDNFTNWCFFSNYRHAMPINRNTRRTAPFFSVIQNHMDIADRGMGDEYFSRIYDWLRTGGGKEAVAHWLMQHPVKRGDIPMRAPRTSSTEAAIAVSMGATERLIWEAIEDKTPGFLNGWVSSLSVDKMLKAKGARHVSMIALDEMLLNLGYHPRGRAFRAWFQDGQEKAYLYCKNPRAEQIEFPIAQGWPE